MEERKGKIKNRIRRSVYDLTTKDFEKEKIEIWRGKTTKAMTYENFPE